VLQTEAEARAELETLFSDPKEVPEVATAHAPQERNKMGQTPFLLSDPPHRGLGYIGSHTCVVLAEAGYELAVVDNLSNSKASVLERIASWRPRVRKISLKRADVRDRSALEASIEGRNSGGHFAGLKAVGESVEKPLLYYENNVGAPLRCCRRWTRRACASWSSALRPPCMAS